jgi:hypothetical protein
MTTSFCCDISLPSSPSHITSLGSYFYHRALSMTASFCCDLSLSSSPQHIISLGSGYSFQDLVSTMLSSLYSILKATTTTNCLISPYHLL